MRTRSLIVLLVVLIVTSVLHAQISIPDVPVPTPSKPSASWLEIIDKIANYIIQILTMVVAILAKLSASKATRKVEEASVANKEVVQQTVKKAVDETKKDLQNQTQTLIAESKKEVATQTNVLTETINKLA